MAETLLVDAATVLAGASTTVEAFAPAVPNPQFRVACNQIHSVRFYVADADFSVITAAAIIPAYTVTAVASTTGTLGNVYTIDLGAYDYVAAVATNNSAFSSVVSIAAGYDLVAEAPSALFTVAEARLHDKAQLASATDFPNAVIITEEAKIRTLFLGACGRDFFPTVHTDEYQDGYGMSSIMLDWPLVMAVSAASIRSDTTWTPLTVAELAQLQPLDTGELYWDGGTWPSGRRNVKVTYTAGYATVPPLIHSAAMDLAVNELPVGNTPWQADSYDAGGTSYSWTRGDGYAGAWSSLPSVMLALRMYGADAAYVGLG